MIKIKVNISFLIILSTLKDNCQKQKQLQYFVGILCRIKINDNNTTKDERKEMEVYYHEVLSLYMSDIIVLEDRL